MLYAKEARAMSGKDEYAEQLKTAVKTALPLCDEAVRTSCGYNRDMAIVKRDVIVKAVGWTLCTRKDVMDALANELREYGYTVIIPESYTSLHINW